MKKPVDRAAGRSRAQFRHCPGCVHAHAHPRKLLCRFRTTGVFTLASRQGHKPVSAMPPIHGRPGRGSVGRRQPEAALSRASNRKSSSRELLVPGKGPCTRPKKTSYRPDYEALALSLLQPVLHTCVTA